MHVARSVLLLMTGAASGIALVLSCGDNLSVKAIADAAVDAPKVADAAPNVSDAAPTCDCPTAEPPLAGRIVTISQLRTIPANDFSGQSAVCPMGSLLITGSCTQDPLNPYRNLTLQQSGFFPPYTTEWVCWFRNNESSPVTVRVSILCLKPMP